MAEKNGIDYEKRVLELEQQAAGYRERIAKLESENELLHETAWGLVHQLHELRKQRKIQAS